MNRILKQPRLQLNPLVNALRDGGLHAVGSREAPPSGLPSRPIARANIRGASARGFGHLAGRCLCRVQSTL